MGLALCTLAVSVFPDVAGQFCSVRSLEDELGIFCAAAFFLPLKKQNKTKKLVGGFKGVGKSPVGFFLTDKETVLGTGCPIVWDSDVLPGWDRQPFPGTHRALLAFCWSQESRLSLIALSLH